MSFLRIDDSHLHVPGKMDVDEMAFLAALAARVPEGGRIVEIGPFYGRSTRVMSLANPTAQITSIDTFENVAWTQRYAAQHPAIPEFGLDAFAQFTADLSNTTPLVGPSPDIVQDWTDPIDMYFEDAVHGNPVLAHNIAFWTGHLKPGGIACGHDYTLRFPDIKREVDALAATWRTQVSLVGSLWALRKPHPSDSPARRTRPLMPDLTDQPSLTLHVKNKRNGLAKAHDGYWCGAHLEADRLLWCQISAPTLPNTLRLEYRVGHPEHGTSNWVAAGTKARLGPANSKPLPFDRLSCRLVGGGNDAPKIGYRVSARQIGQGGQARSGTSDWCFDGAWARAPGVGLAMNAMTVSFFDVPPADAQTAFPSARGQPRGKKILRRLVRKLTDRPATNRDLPQGRGK